MISTLQNSIVAYKALQLTYPLIVGIAAQVIFFFFCHNIGLVKH